MKLVKQIERDFTTVHNAFLKDESLSIAARGLLMTMLSLPPEWNFSIKGLSKILKSDGERKISTALKELEEHHFLVRRRICDDTGKVTDWEYIISDEKIPEEILKKSFNYKNKTENVENISEDIPEIRVSDNVECNVETDVENLDSAEETPYRSYPHLQNADVVNADVDNSHLVNPHPETVNDNIYKQNSKSKNKKLSDKSIIQSKTTAERNEEMRIYKQVIYGHIEYDSLIEAYKNPDIKMPGSIEQLNEICSIMLECICSEKPTIRACKEEIPQEVFKNNMMKLNSNHIIYIMESLEENTSKIKNIKSQLFTMHLRR